MRGRGGEFEFQRGGGLRHTCWDEGPSAEAISGSSEEDGGQRRQRSANEEEGGGQKGTSGA